MNLINALEELALMAAGNSLSEEFLSKAVHLTDYIGGKLHTTPVESAILAALIDNGCSPTEGADMPSVRCMLGLGGVRSLLLEPHLNNLMIKKILIPSSAFNYSLLIHKDLAESICNDAEYNPEDDKCIDTVELLMKFDDIVSELFLNNERADRKYCMAMLNLLLKENKDLPFIRKISSYALDETDTVILLQICSFLCIDNIECIEKKHIYPYFESKFKLKRFWDSLTRGNHVFFQKNLIENYCNDGLADNESFQLTAMAKEELLGDTCQNTLQKRRNGGNVILSADIAFKEMFYNDQEKKQVERLASLLSEENYSDIRARLREKGMRTGFPVLLYGSPGTGKTETVMQIAKATGRDILLVDISNIRNKWVGESEKNIKHIFDSYNSIARKSRLTPILLFNEADALITKRTNDVEHSVDKMENAMQNIILQEMENLEGILIATTNMTCNMDPAFERRFLYKIEFRTPESQSREKIWKNMIPGLDDSTASKLASNYNFSGGQIENIARKMTIESILTGAEPTFQDLEMFCRNESINDGRSVARKRIGF